MSTDFNAEAQLTLRLSADEITAVKGVFDEASDSAGGLEGAADRVQQRVNSLVREMRGVERASEDWDQFSGRLKQVAKDYQRVAREAAAANKAAPTALNFAAGQGVSRDEIGRFQDGSSADLFKDAAREVGELEQAHQRLIAVQSQRAQADAEDARLQKQAAWNARDRADAEARLTQELARQAAQQRNAQRASSFQADGVDSRMGRETAGTSAAGTGLAQRLRDEEAASQRAVRALREHDAALNANNVSLKASETTFVRAARAQDEMANSLPRLRYAMYDVARTATTASGVLTGFGVAALAASASFESAFTNVERTSDPVSTNISELRSELSQLSREIPLSFQDISAITAMGNQLGIASTEVGDFTEMVAMFTAASPEVTAQETAQAFGAMAQIMGLTSDEYIHLASSIQLVGRTSVATDKEILSMTREIAQQATSAGFASDQIVGLSGALASLRLPPERSRGSLTTYFGTLNRAVADGGERLEHFANIVGVTSGELEEMVRAGQGYEVLLGFLDGLSRSDDVVELAKSFDALGLSQLRTSDTFTRLSQNMDLVASSMSIANDGYVEGTELSRQYGLIQDDLASQFQLLVNAVQEAAAAFGDTLAPAIIPLIQLITTLIQGFTDFAQTPIGSVVLGIAGGLGTLAAALLAVVGVTATGIASMAALKTAISSLGWTGATTGVAGFTNQLFRMRDAAGAATVATGGAATAVNVFRGALVSTGIGAAVVLLGTLAGALMNVGSAAERAIDSYGGASGIGAALAEDTAQLQDASQAVASFTAELPEQQVEIANTGAEAKNFAAIMGEVYSAGKAAAEGAVEDALLWGEATSEYVKNQLRQSEILKEAGESDLFTAYFAAIGADVDEAIEIAATQGEEGVREYFNRLQAAAQREGAAGVGVLDVGGLELNMGELNEISHILNELAVQIGSSQTAAQNASNEMYIMGDAASALGDDLEYTGEAADYAATGIGGLGDEASSALQATFDLADGQIALHRALHSLGEGVVEGAGAWDYYSEAGRTNIGNLMGAMEAIANASGGSSEITAANFAALYDQLINGGHASAEQLSILAQAIASLAGTSEQKLSELARQGEVANGMSRALGKISGFRVPTVDFSSMFAGASSGAEKLAKSLGSGGGGVSRAAREAREEVRTLVDYARDLEGVFSRAFEIRWGSAQSMDAIRSSWHQIRDATEEARRKVQEYRAELRDLQATRAVTQYWLGVAESYGDDLRAKELRAELAKNNKDVAETQRNLRAEQDAASKSIQGNSQAAIENRNQLLNLVSQYQGYLASLASSGASQDELARKTEELRQDFIRQGMQLGYSRSDLNLYARSFDDVKTAIDRVPRNITVRANANPAIQALNELKARAQDMARSVEGSAGRAQRALGSIGGSGAQSYTAQANRLRYVAQYMGQIAIAATMQARAVAAALGGNAVGAAAYTFQGNLAQSLAATYRRAGGFYTGGYTGAGGKFEPRGVVHADEYVFNKKATSFLGPNFLDRMHTMAQRGQMPTLGGGGASGVVALDAGTLQALSQLFNVSFVVDGRVLATTTGAQYAHMNDLGSF